MLILRRTDSSNSRWKILGLTSEGKADKLVRTLASELGDVRATSKTSDREVNYMLLPYRPSFLVVRGGEVIYDH